MAAAAGSDRAKPAIHLLDQPEAAPVLPEKRGTNYAHCLINAGRVVGLSALVAVALLACGGSKVQSTSLPHARLQEGPRQPEGPLAHIPSATPATMAATPRALLDACLDSKLLRPVCPRRVPAANARHTQIRRLGNCIDASGHDLTLNGHYAQLDSRRCVEVTWGYEAVGWPPGYTPGEPVTAAGLDPRTNTAAPAESGLISPPVHVHIEIEASTRPPAQSGLTGSTALAPSQPPTPFC
jgi:hypothetical protein